MGDADILELQIIKLPGLLSTVNQDRALLTLSQLSYQAHLYGPSLQVAFSYIIDRTEAQSGNNALVLVGQNFRKVKLPTDLIDVL